MCSGNFVIQMCMNFYVTFFHRLKEYNSSLLGMGCFKKLKIVTPLTVLAQVVRIPQTTWLHFLLLHMN